MMDKEDLIRRIRVRFEIAALYAIALDVQKYSELKWMLGAQWNSDERSPLSIQS